MISGAIKGFIAGGVIGFGAIGVASVVLPMRGAPELAETAPDLNATVTSGRANVPVKVELSADPVPVKSAPTPSAADAGVDTLVALSAAANAPDVRPQAGDRVVAPSSEVALPSGIGAVSAEMPVAPRADVSPLNAPQSRDVPVAQTSSAIPVAPAPVGTDGAFEGPAQPQADSADFRPAPATPQTGAPATAAALPRSAGNLLPRAPQPSVPQADQQTPLQPSVTVAQPDPNAGTVPDAPAAQSLPIQVAANDRAPTVQPAQPTAPNAPQALQATGTPEPASDDLSSNMPGSGGAKRIVIGRTTAPERAKPAVEPAAQEGGQTADTADTADTATPQDTGVSIRRAGVPANEAAAEPAPAPTEATSAASDIEDRAAQSDNPLVANAEAFENPEGKPLMSIVLLDDGTAAFDADGKLGGFENFPYPLSFAVDAALPDAQQRARAFRKAGFEVLALVDLPTRALPTDAETTFAVVLPRMPEVVGVLEGLGEGFQSSRDVSDQVTAILEQAQLGLVTQPKGLNTMSTLAVKEGVAAVPVFRDFDSKGQSATVIRRFLDQAAFRARQEGAVIMMGRIRPETTEALLLWGLQDRASSVALAPVSAALRSTQP